MRVLRFWHFLMIVGLALASVLTANSLAKAGGTSPYYYTEKMGCGADRFCHFDVVEGTMTGTAIYSSEQLAVIQVDQLGTWDYDGQGVVQSGWLPAGFWKTAESRMVTPQPVMHAASGTYKLSFGIGTPPYAGGPLKAFIGQHVRLIGTKVNWNQPPPFWGFAYYIAGNPISNEPVTVSLTATPDLINIGDNSHLKWAATGSPDHLELFGPNGVIIPRAANPTGFTTIQPSVTSTYTIKAFRGTTVAAQAQATIVVQAAAPCSQSDIMTVFDRSGSMGTVVPSEGITRLDMTKAAVNDTLDYIQTSNSALAANQSELKTRDGLATFSTDARLDNPLTDTFAAYRSILNSLVPDQWTAIGSGLQVAQTELTRNSRKGAHKVIIVLSDGENNRGPNPIQVANAIKQAGIEIYSISVDTAGVMPKLASDNTAQAPQHYFHDPDGSALRSIFYQIIESVCRSNPIALTLNANPPTIVEGQSSTLDWTSQNAAHLSLDQGIGDVTIPNGSKTVLPSFTTTYTLTGSNSDLTQGKRVSATVEVQKKLQFYVIDKSTNKPIPGASISVDPSLLSASSDFKDHLIAGPDGYTNPTFINYANKDLIPGATFATTVTADNYIPSSQTWARKAGFQVVTIALSQVQGQTSSLQFRVRDSSTNAPIGNVRILPDQTVPNLTVQDLFTGADGQTDPRLINYGNLVSGQHYKAEAMAVGYQTATKSWTWTPNKQVVDIIMFKAPPTVTLTANPPVIGPGEASTLTWDSTNATSLSIDHGVGSVANPGGAQAVLPTRTTVYTITATGPGGTATATATVTVTNKPYLKFCVQTTTTDGITQPILGAHVSPDTSTNLLTSPTNIWTSFDETGFHSIPPYLITGSDGCTNPTFINYSKVTLNNTYHYLATAEGYADVSANWPRNAMVQIVYINLPPVGVLGNVQKSSVVLTGENQTSPVTISFDITANSVDNVQLHEVLANNQLSFVPNTKGTLTKPDGTTQDFTSPSSGSWDANFGTLPVGTHYQFTFQMKYTGAKGTTSAIDAFSNGKCNDPSIAHINYSLNSQTNCAPVLAGQLEKRAARLILNSDAWVGDKPVTFDGTSFQAGPHTLIVSGENVSGQNDIVPVQNYKFPGTGLAAWSTLSNLFEQRVQRAIDTKRARSVDCPQSDNLWLNGVTSLTDPSGGTQDNQVWLLSNCQLNWQTVHFHGHGTIINRGDSASLTLHGDVLPADLGATLGYISNGPVTLYDQASLSDVALYTSKSLTIGPTTSNNSSLIESSVPDPMVQPKTNHAKLIANQIQFPDRNKLRSDITLEKSQAVEATPPPLFEQFILPQGNEVP